MLKILTTKTSGIAAAQKLPDLVDGTTLALVYGAATGAKLKHSDTAGDYTVLLGAFESRCSGFVHTSAQAALYPTLHRAVLAEVQAMKPGDSAVQFGAALKKSGKELVVDFFQAPTIVNLLGEMREEADKESTVQSAIAPTTKPAKSKK